MVKKIVINCEECNKEKEVRISEIKRGYGKFCSRSCSAINKNKKRTSIPNVICANCEKKFYKNKSDKKQSKSGLYFCCRKCKDKAQRIGGIKEIQPNHYGDELKDYRKILIKNNRLNFCERCGYDKIPKILEVHHKDRNRYNNKLNNLIALCPTCHNEDHYKNNDGKFSNWGISLNG